MSRKPNQPQPKFCSPYGLLVQCTNVKGIVSISEAKHKIPNVVLGFEDGVDISKVSKRLCKDYVETCRRYRYTRGPQYLSERVVDEEYAAELLEIWKKIHELVKDDSDAYQAFVQAVADWYQIVAYNNPHTFDGKDRGSKIVTDPVKDLTAALQGCSISDGIIVGDVKSVVERVMSVLNCIHVFGRRHEIRKSIRELAEYIEDILNSLLSRFARSLQCLLDGQIHEEYALLVLTKPEIPSSAIVDAVYRVGRNVPVSENCSGGEAAFVLRVIASLI